MSTAVIKIGGDILRTGAAAAVAADVAALGKRGDRTVLVHGGGPQATAMQERLGQKPNIVAGRRITDRDALEVMKMVVGGSVNIDLCAALLAAGAKPIGLHGASSMAVRASKRPPRVVAGGGPDPIDFGHVGDVTGVNQELIAYLLDAGYVPVIACIGADDRGNLFNINADIVANQLSDHISADHLVLVTGARGVLRDVEDPASRIETLSAQEARAAIADGTVVGGMIPKLEESIRILESGAVKVIHIVGQVQAGDILRELQHPGSVGTALRLS